MLFDKVLLATLKFSIDGVHILNKLVFIVSKTCIKEPKRSMSQRVVLSASIGRRYWTKRKKLTSPRNFAALDESAKFKPLLFSSSICSEIGRACLVYNLNVPIKAKDPPWFAVQMGSVADSVAAKIRIIIDNTNFSARNQL